MFMLLSIASIPLYRQKCHNKRMTIASWLEEATRKLHEGHIGSARLDAELILSHTIRKPRTHLHAHSEDQLDQRHEEIADARLELRLNNTPVAYIVGHKEFYGRRFTTTPAALIPRPETEVMIDMVKTIIPQDLAPLPEPLRVVDVGTGTGCIGITVKKEWPELDVTLTDISNHALNLAKENAARLVADVQFMQSDLLHGYTLPIDIILANLPYVARQWEVSADANAEPQEALYADDDGLALIYQLLDQATLLLRPSGHILLESDPRQQQHIIEHAESLGYHHDRTEGFMTMFSRP